MKDVYKYREFLKTSIVKEFRGKYKKSFLGVLWSFINPLLQLLIYTLVFSTIMRADIDHFTVFLVVALIPWNFFNTTIVSAASCIVNNSSILKKIYFPREILPISIVTSNLINFLISSIIVVIALIISGIGLSWYIIFIPFIIIIQYIFSLALSFFISAITVYIRDLEYFINVLMMLWFYLCPIVYSAELIPKQYEKIFNLNPMLHLINSYRDVLYYQSLPRIKSLLILFVVSSLFLILGYKTFKNLEKRFVEEL